MTKDKNGKSYNGLPSSHSNGKAVTGPPNRAGSENSLLDEDDWGLARGMDEDGSFREGRYAQ